MNHTPTHTIIVNQPTLLRVVLIALLLLFLCPAAHALIERKYTPANMVKESQTVFAGTVTGDAAKGYVLTATETLKGTAPKQVTLTVATAPEGTAESIGKIFAANGNQPVLAFLANNGKIVRLHAAGEWLRVRPTATGWADRPR